MLIAETPLSIDTSDPVAMEIALKNYPGHYPHQLRKMGREGVTLRT